MPTRDHHEDPSPHPQGAKDRFLHSTFGTSRLVRLLGAWAPVDADRSGMDFAERTSLWLGPLDAIRLQSAHRAPGRATAAVRGPVRGRANDALDDDVRRVRGVLARAIAQDPLALANLEPGDPDFGYPPFRQRHLDLQRQMEQMVTALREHLRQAAAARSPRLRQLAELDAALQEVLAAREQKLLPTAAALLERRFAGLRRAHRQAQEAAGQADDPAQWQRPGGWLHAFAQDWQQALMAELDLRLEPVAGLLDALRHEHEHPA